MGDELTAHVLRDWRTAPIGKPLRATLALLEKLTLEPGASLAKEVANARAAGVSDAALEDAVHVCAVFNTIDRIADSMDFHVPGPAVFHADAKMLLRRGYL